MNEKIDRFDNALLALSDGVASAAEQAEVGKYIDQLEKAIKELERDIQRESWKFVGDIPLEVDWSKAPKWAVWYARDDIGDQGSLWFETAPAWDFDSGQWEVRKNGRRWDDAPKFGRGLTIARRPNVAEVQS
jgi:hypothetical protein